MKIQWLVIAIFFNISAIISQSVDYVGFIKLENDTYINYKLELEIRDGKVNGYSFTDLNGDHETKSSVVGSYNNKNKDFEFREVDIIYTKSPVNEFDFCYIFFKGKFDDKRLSGNFKSYYEDLESCINGDMIMSEAGKVEKRREKITRKVERTLARRKMEDTISDKLRNMKFGEKRGLRNGENLNVFWKKSYLKLSVWDAGTVDNDTILLSFNDENPLRIIPGKQISVREFYLKGESNTISIQAVSEGSEPPNTTKIKLSDGDGQTIDLISDLKVGEKTTLTFYREIPKKK